MTIGVIIVAAGQGTRMGGDMPKQFLPLKGRSILARTLEKFDKALPDSRKVVVLSESMVEFWQGLSKSENCGVEHEICRGGRERFFSVQNAVATLKDVDYIMVHDAVRPLLSCEMIQNALESAVKNGSAIPCVRAVDSFREIQGDDSVALNRELLRAVQTPQIFTSELLVRAYAQDYDKNFTDDASVVQSLGEKVYLCGGEYHNIKITNPLDIKIAELILEQDEL